MSPNKHVLQTDIVQALFTINATRIEDNETTHIIIINHAFFVYVLSRWVKGHTCNTVVHCHAYVGIYYYGGVKRK